jgi:heme/copper-type cytochrome/quinol oxidase subunit 2
MSLIVAEAKDRETMEERARNLMARERDGLMLRWSFCIPITLLVLYTFGLRAVKLKKESKGRDAGIS